MNQNLLSPSLESFLDELIKTKHFSENVTDTFIEESKAELRPLLLKKINYALYESLSPTDRQEFEHLAESDASDEDLQQFLFTHIVNPEQVVAEALLSFRNSYLG